MSEADFFAQTSLDLSEVRSTEEADAALAGLLVLCLRHTYDEWHGSWPGNDEQDTLRRTIHAVEVLHRLSLDAHTATMVRDAGNWLINLPVRDRLPVAERNHMRLYPSRFKTLAYLGRFDDDQVRRDFDELLRQEVGGMLRGVTESDVLTTCIALDTVLSLDALGRRREICPDERRDAFIRALRQQFNLWRPTPTVQTTASRPADEPLEEPASRTTKRPAARSEIANPRDLSYTLGLLLQSDRVSMKPRQLDRVQQSLLATIQQRDRSRHSDIMQVLYAALQLAEHFVGNEQVNAALTDLLAELRGVYQTPEVPRRWDLAYHTLVLRLLVTYYEALAGTGSLTRAIAGHFVREAEHRRQAVRNTFEVELEHVIRDRLNVQLGQVSELTGGFTEDHIYRVPFSYWFPLPGSDGDNHPPLGPLPSTSLIIKRSTSDAFHTSTENYSLLPPALRDYFVRQPSRSQVYQFGESSAYYLPMEDLTDLQTFHDLFNELDQRAMAPQQTRLLRAASAQVSEVAFALFRESQDGRGGLPGTQLARLYLSRIEKSLVRSIARIPWLKSPLQTYHVGDLRLKGLDYYLSLITRQAHVLQPRLLGLVHGDFHSRNIMLDRMCTQVKLIDLDKLSWSGDYIADLGDLLADVCVYRRVAEPERDFGLPREDIVFVTRSADAGTAENAVRYPALGRPATLAFQQHLFEEIREFAEESGDANWQPRLWLSAATALLVRIQHHAEREVAAVLYGEAGRWLQELSRFLEHSQPLPALLVPATWPEPAAPVADVPGWVSQSEILRKVHEGLRKLGLRPEVEHDTVRYHTPTDGDGPYAALVPARRDGIARLLLRSNGNVFPQTELQVIRSGQDGGALSTIVIVPRDASPSEILRLARASMGH
jgi:hypothetical protein